MKIDMIALPLKQKGFRIMELVEKNTIVVNDLHFVLDTVDDHAIECIQDNYDNILKIKRTGFIL